MMTSEWFTYRNPALARSWCSTGDAGACSDAENHRQSGRQDRRSNKSPKHRITQIGCLVFDDSMQLAATSSIHHAVEEVKSP